MNTKIIIAIDGHSSTGKSTVAKQLAKELDYTYVDTGAMYRAVAWYAMENGIVNQTLNKELLIRELPNIEIRFIRNPKLTYAETYVNGVNVENQIRTLEVSKWVSTVAAIPEVRVKLVDEQRKIATKKGVVMDGRDIGTVVFPDAELKIFMTASAEIRAKRRFNEMIAKGENVTYEEILDNVTSRDHLDSSRKSSPLVQAKDAVVIDNSNISQEEQLNHILKLVNDLV